MIKYKIKIKNDGQIDLLDLNDNLIKSNIHILEVGDYVFKGLVNITSEQHSKILDMMLNKF